MNTAALVSSSERAGSAPGSVRSVHFLKGDVPKWPTSGPFATKRPGAAALRSIPRSCRGRAMSLGSMLAITAALHPGLWLGRRR
jgi:hypothetical protein